MTTEERDELAIAYLLGDLQGAARRDFEAEMQLDAALRREVDRLQEAFGELALAAPTRPLPQGLRERVLAVPAGEIPAVETPGR